MMPMIFFIIKEIDKKISDKKANLRVKIINSEIIFFSFVLFVVEFSYIHGKYNIDAFWLFFFGVISNGIFLIFIPQIFFPLYVAKQYMLDEPIIVTEGFHE